MNSKYNSKSLAKIKARKRAGSSLKKDLIQKQRHRKLHSQPASPTLKNIIPLKNRKTIYFRRNLNWKVPVISMLAGLIAIIIALPATVIFFFGDARDDGEMAASVPAEKGPAIEAGASPFSVAVMRSTEQSVEEVPLETYVAGVVASEMPASFELEALKAQALAARTFTVSHLLNGNGEENYDVTDTVKHQVYKSDGELQTEWGTAYNEKMNKIKEAVDATKGQIITYKDAPITAQFFSTSNGYTENSEDYWENEIAYLRSVESPWDRESPKFMAQQTFSSQQLEEVLQLDLPEGMIEIELSRTESGRVREMVIGGKQFTGREVREKLNLNSNDFSIEQNKGHFIFTTEGYGHGVGMSQYGANGMAKEGKTYEDIIHHYYKDVTISTINETAPALVSR